MPQGKVNDTIVRQWELLRQLPARPPGATAKELRAALLNNGFEVSKRTVERDLIDLSRYFPLSCNDKSRPYGWHWAPGATFDIPNIPLAEAVSIQAIEEYIRFLLPHSVRRALEPKFNQARKRLQTLSDENLMAKWQNKVRAVAPSLPTKPPDIENEVLETVQEALFHDRRLDVSYLPHMATAPASMELHPLGLIQRGPITYLAATAYDYEDVRLYAIHRIKKAFMKNEPIKESIPFDIDEYIESGAIHFGEVKAIRLKAVVSNDLAVVLRESPISDDMKLIHRKEGVHVTATVNDTWQLWWWVLSQADGIKILSPKAFRDGIIGQHKKALEQYNDD